MGRDILRFCGLVAYFVAGVPGSSWYGIIVLHDRTLALLTIEPVEYDNVVANEVNRLNGYAYKSTVVDAGIEILPGLV